VWAEALSVYLHAGSSSSTPRDCAWTKLRRRRRKVVLGNPDSPTAVLGQVEAAEALSVYVQVNRHPRHEIAAPYNHYSLAHFVFTHFTTASGSRHPWTGGAVRTLQ
jgi:hypothetical protein